MENEINANAGQPEKRFRAGALSVTIWQNQGQTKTGEETTYKTVSFQRRYKDKNGEWQTSNSLRVNDLPKVSLLMDKAYEFIVLQGNEDD